MSEITKAELEAAVVGNMVHVETVANASKPKPDVLERGRTILDDTTEGGISPTGSVREFVADAIAEIKRLGEWEEACKEIDMGGIYDTFESPADAIRQLGHYIHEAEEELPAECCSVEGASLKGRIFELREQLREYTEAEVVWQARRIVYGHAFGWSGIHKSEVEDYTTRRNCEVRALAVVAPKGETEE